MENKKKITNSQWTHLISSAFLMMTSAIGPAFLTQTAVFTESHGASFAFVILISVIISIGAQLNIWRILTGTGKYAQDIANEVLPGFGYVLSFLIVLGGVAFNIGNVAGGGLGLQAIFGLEPVLGAIIIGLICIIVFSIRNGKSLVDRLVQILGTVMLLLCIFVAIKAQPPLGEVAYRTVVPENLSNTVMPIITIVGGTVGGYITFSGAHRLIESGMTGEENIRYTSISSVVGILATGVMRVFLFLAVLGTIYQGAQLAPANPAAAAFEFSLGRLGGVLFGLILFCAAISSVIGAAYTSASFIRTFHPIFDRYNNWVIVGFIALSTIIFAFVGQPVTLLILAGAFNGLILPITLGLSLIAANKKSITGNYKHPLWMTIYGVIAALVTLIVGIISLGGLSQLFG